MKIGFTGTRKGMTTHQYQAVSNILMVYKDKIQEVHHGDAIGADKDFHDIAKSLDIKVILHPPINSEKRAFCRADVVLSEKEYLDRNHDIVNDSDLMIATPAENINVLRSGTWSTIRYSKKKRKNTIIIFRDGKIKY